MTDAYDDYTEEEKQKIIDILEESEQFNPFDSLGLPNPFWRFYEVVKDLVRAGKFAEAEQALDDRIKKWQMVVERRKLDMVEAALVGEIDAKTWLALTISAIQAVDRQLYGFTDVEDYCP